ncbi:permease-like cell division protein FtsX [Velocimicrobium porci]|uniref:Cell division protein FtsX n=1 Tax=Velocimicrobium porci TaxID=2606634 RepID=A0A6L5Y1K4_9FIRM|nr:permease-like cell division protein FtsX [Velocimicrobium porci]MSS64794.1 ABC transporter permease [Velocimicrobium porci]
MARINTFNYSVKQGVKNIHRNRLFSLASIGTITACLFLFGIFYFILANFQHIVKDAESSFGVTVFFDEGITEGEVQAIGDKIRARSEVKEVVYTSAEEAWDTFKDNYYQSYDELLKSFGDDNPLADSASYGVYLKDISKQKKFVTYVEGLKGVRKVESIESAAKVMESANSFIAYVSGAIIIILLAVSIFLINTTVMMGIAVRKEEIYIMRLVGATDFFIRAPFIVEGALIGLIGAVIPLGILYLVYDRVISLIMQKYAILASKIHFLEVGDIFGGLIPIALLLGLGIGLAGSYLTVRKHLRV